MANRIWTAQRISPTAIRVFVNSIPYAQANYRETCAGNGWAVLPLAAASGRSRKLWVDPVAAVKSAIGAAAADAIKAIEGRH